MKLRAAIFFYDTTQSQFDTNILIEKKYSYSNFVCKYGFNFNKKGEFVSINNVKSENSAEAGNEGD